MARPSTGNGQTDFQGIEFPVRKHKRFPEVTVFEEPGKKRKKYLSKSHQGQGKTKFRSSKIVAESNDTSSDVVENDLEFNSIVKEVREFGVSGFSKKDKKKYLQEMAQALGARKPKGQKIPYPILQYAVKVRKEREMKQKEYEKAMGIFTKKKKNSKKIDVKGSGRWIEKPLKLEKADNNIRLKRTEISSMGKKK